MNLYYNDYEKDLVRNTSNSRNYVFTGQVARTWRKKSIMIGSDYFQSYKKLGVKITRLDIALDDFHGVLSFPKMENKLVKRTLQVI